MTVINSATYQGYPVKSLQFRREEGLGAEVCGFVIVDYSVIKSLSLKSDAVPWRGDDGGADLPGAISIHVWWEIFGKKAGTRTADKPFSQPASGLRLYGPLVMASSGDGISESVRYDDIYVANAEEVSENYARALEHREGEIRIDLTDIRQFYQKYGGMVGRINCRLENGKYDPRTIKKPGRRVGRGGTTTAEELAGTPWSFEEVVRYLFSQIPGGPSVNLTGLTNMPPPEEIDSIGSPAAGVLQTVLENYGLVAKMQPNGSYFVAKKLAKFIERGQVARSVGKPDTPPHTSYEIKSASRIDTPPVVMVLGGRRYRRATVTYVPVFKDQDGKMYRLSDIDLVFDGYSILQVNVQAPKDRAKNFQDVLPRPFRRNISDAELERIRLSGVGIPGTAEGQAQDDLHYGRRDILRAQAYRMYAPSMLFGDDAPVNAKGAPYFSDLDDRAFAFLPMGPAPLFESQLSELSPRARKVPGDRGRVVLANPVVRGCMIDEALYTNNFEIAKRYQKVIDGLQTDFRKTERDFDIITDRIPGLRAEFLRADGFAAATEFLESELLNLLVPGLSTFGRRRLQDAIAAKRQSVAEKAGLESMLKAIQARMDALKKAIDRLKIQRADDLQKLALHGGVEGIGQIPYGVVPENKYSLDPSTGVLTFSKLCCVVDHPLVFDQEDLTVLGDGTVSVTFGHPLDYNEPSDFTSILFCKDGKGGAKLCGANRGSPIKPHIIRDPDLVMYEEDSAEPMNLKSCIEQAEKKAKQILEGADTTEGFVRQFSGFVQCVLERGINRVEFTWYGGTAYTYVAVHSPGWAGPPGK